MKKQQGGRSVTFEDARAYINGDYKKRQREVYPKLLEEISEHIKKYPRPFNSFWDLCGTSESDKKIWSDIFFKILRNEHTLRLNALLLLRLFWGLNLDNFAFNYCAAMNELEVDPRPIWQIDELTFQDAQKYALAFLGRCVPTCKGPTVELPYISRALCSYQETIKSHMTEYMRKHKLSKEALVWLHFPEHVEEPFKNCDYVSLNEESYHKLLRRAGKERYPEAGLLFDMHQFVHLPLNRLADGGQPFSTENLTRDRASLWGLLLAERICTLTFGV